MATANWWGSCTVTCRRKISWSRTTACPKSWISASPKRRLSAAARRLRDKSRARSRTWHPSKSRAGQSIAAFDLFAMGIVLYALTTGKHPFRRESEAATMYNICAPQPVMPPRKILPEYPVELEQVVVKALSKDPDKRYQTANELLKALDQLPQSQRASTDEDVGKFVMSLFGDRRAERHAAMTEALARAEEIARTRDAQPIMSSPDPLRQSVHSQVSYVTRTGVTANDFSGVPSTSNATGAMTGIGQTSPRRKLVMGAAIAALALLAGGLLAALKSRGSTEDTSKSFARAQASASVSVQASSSAVSDSASSQAQAAEAVKPDAGVSLETAAESAGKAVRNWGKPSKSPITAPANAGSAPSKNKTPPVTTWKQDPGF